MSHTVVRGQPTAAQLYLDSVLDEILQSQGLATDPAHRANVTLPQILFHCLKKRPQAEFMTNGATGEVITNEQLLKRIVSLSRALTTGGMKGKHAIFLMRNHQDMSVVYFAVMFTGIIPFIIDPKCTSYELTYYMKLIEPSLIFCDLEFQKIVNKSIQDCSGLAPAVVLADQPGALQMLSRGHSDDVHDFQVADASMDDTVMWLPTSGSTGMPKAAMLTHTGLVTQLPGSWMYHTQFPTPTPKAMVLTTIQWMTFTMLMTSCVVYHVPLLMSPKIVTVEHVIEMLEKFRPTWTFLAPAFASSLVKSVEPHQLTSLRTLILLGAPVIPELMAALKKKLPKTTHLCDGYGTSETQGFIAIPDSNTPNNRNGRVFNFMYYKIVDENGQELGLNETGELFVKGTCLIKGYHKDNDTYNETFIDGWYKTGDVFHIDENEEIAFVVRRKFTFKYKGCHVAPEEVERVIQSVPGVQESVVCSSDKGPAAAVVVRLDDVTRNQIHHAVNCSLSDHKRLHGGIAFVTSLPHTHSGKLKRSECSKLIAELIKNGQCF